MGNLRQIERKMFGAMIVHSDTDMVVRATRKQLANTMGYKTVGGALTFAIQSLEMKNYIAIKDNGEFVILL